VNKKILISFLLLFLLASCQNPGTKTLQEMEGTDFYAFTPEPGKAVVSGKLLDSSFNEPYEASLFLSKNLTAEYPGYPPVISFSYQTNPRAAQDDEGNFIFKNIEPGNYVIVLYKPTGQDFLKDGNNELPKMFNLKANEVVDLGILYFP